MQLKICGLRQTENIKSLLALQPGYLGFIFYEKSKRYAEGILDERFTKLYKFSKPNLRNPKKTGVFVNEDLNKIKSSIKKYGLNAVQLHGDESPEYCRALKSGGDLKSPPDLEIIKVFSVNDDFDFNKTKIYEDVCDLFLFDTKGKERGGNGIAFNWHILNKYDGEKPFFLSGGIGPGDAAEIKKIKHPKLYGVDINSRFEIEPGLKDVEMVEQFIAELK
ncbi:MAG TPA: phosphoribosylanthranilate isomerase [Bacteroidetes bacterium]|nr:phosphoribosylanthranilate isomerase [Bacteroidota bacterium]